MDEPTSRPADREPDQRPGTTAGDPADDRGSAERGATDASPDEVTAAEIDQAAALAGTRAERMVEDLIETELETGQREGSVEEAKRHLAIRIASVVGGSIVLILGLAMMVLPGPGLIVIAIGLGILATEVPFARRLLDRVRARLPQDEDGSLPRSTIIMMVVVGVGAIALSVAFSVWRLNAS